MDISTQWILWTIPTGKRKSQRHDACDVTQVEAKAVRVDADAAVLIRLHIQLDMMKTEMFL
jgi:hypothetical protein